MNNQIIKKEQTLQDVINSEAVQDRFQEVLKDKANSFTSSVITLVNNDTALREAQPKSVIAGAMQAAVLDLPLEKQFGFAYLVPFNEKDKTTGRWVKKAQFILGYRGYIQLAQRSGQYKSINVVTAHEGEIKKWNPLTEEIEFDPESRKSDKVTGYIGYMKLLNGFEKTTYWTKEQIEEHRIRNNKAKNKKQLTGVWASNYDAMAQKTVLRNLLSKWGILSTEMRKAIVSDDITTYEEDPIEIISATIDEENAQEFLEFSDDEETGKKEQAELKQNALFENLADVTENIEPEF